MKLSLLHRHVVELYFIPVEVGSGFTVPRTEDAKINTVYMLGETVGLHTYLVQLVTGVKFLIYFSAVAKKE